MRLALSKKLTPNKASWNPVLRHRDVRFGRSYGFRLPCRHAASWERWLRRTGLGRPKKNCAILRPGLAFGELEMVPFATWGY